MMEENKKEKEEKDKEETRVIDEDASLQGGGARPEKGEWKR